MLTKSQKGILAAAGLLLLKAQIPLQTPLPLQPGAPLAPTPLIEKIHSEQKLVAFDSGEWNGTTTVQLTPGASPTLLRFYFPPNRQLDSVQQSGQALNFTHQGGVLTIYPAGGAVAPVTLKYSSKIEALRPSLNLRFKDYQLSFDVETRSTVFSAKTKLTVEHRALEVKSSIVPPLPLPPKRYVTLGLNQAYALQSVTSSGKALKYRHQQGNLRIELPTPLSPGQSASLEVSYKGKIQGLNRYQVWDLPLGTGLYYYPSHPLRNGVY